MASLRSVHAAIPLPPSATGCLETFDREMDYVYGTLQRLGASPADMDDLLQDVFLILYSNWSTLDTTRTLRPWLFGVAFRVVRTQRRRRARERCDSEIDPVDAAVGPEGWLEERESLVLLASALEQVPAGRRSVIVMHDIDGIEVVDIARKMGMTKFGVYARLYKGRQELAAAVRRLQTGARLK
jgi:RNA polymerase sigma-70 factor (ECF subfamily)